MLTKPNNSNTNTQDVLREINETKLFCAVLIMIIIIIILTAIVLSPGGSGYFTCTQNMKLVTTKFKSGGLHEKHVVATWNLGSHLHSCL